MRNGRLLWPAWPSPRLAAMDGVVSAAAASPAASPAVAQSRTLIFTVHFSRFDAPHLNPKPDSITGFGFGDEPTFMTYISPTATKHHMSCLLHDV
jgi:hypothetical protein